MNNQAIPKLVAHRGYMRKFPENSWLGLRAAMDAGACLLEFDIQMCTDGKFILMHDADLIRTANNSKSIFEIGAEELKIISVHEPTRFENKFYPLHIITLDDVLKKLSNYPRVMAMIEIKEESLEHWGLSNVMEQLITKLEPFSSHCVLLSFNYDAMEYVKNNSDIKIGWVLKRYDQEYKINAVSLNPDYLICNYKKLPKNGPPWQGLWEWVLYEINSPKTALEWGAQGIKYIETGDIGTMLMDSILVKQACYHGV